MPKETYFTYLNKFFFLRYPVFGLNGKYPPQAHAFQHWVPSWLVLVGEVGEPLEVKPCWRNYVTGTATEVL